MWHRGTVVIMEILTAVVIVLLFEGLYHSIQKNFSQAKSSIILLLNQPFLTVFFSLGDKRDWSSTRSCMFVMLASFTTHIHEAISQKKTEISNWVTDGKTAVDRKADVICCCCCCCCWFFSFYNILEEYLSVVRQYRKGGVLAHCYQTKVNLYFHVKLTVISFSFDCNYCSLGTMFLMLFWTRVENKLPWVPGAFHARFPVSVKSLKFLVAREKKPLVPREKNRCELFPHFGNLRCV